MPRPPTLALALLATAALAGTVSAQADPLRYDVSPGVQRVFDRSTQTEMQVRSGETSSRRVTEVSARREMLVVETKDDPPRLRVVTFETPSGERLVAQEENGEDRLAEVPEARRLRPLPPMLAAHWLHATGRPVEPPPEPRQPTEAIDRAVAELRYLPAEPLGPDTPRTREVDLGIARLQITTRRVPAKAEDDAAAVVLQTTGRLSFTGDAADRLTVTRLEARSAWAADGSGLLSQRGTLVLEEKADQGTQHLTRTWEEQLQETGRLAPAALEKARQNLEALEEAMADARAGKLDDAIGALQAYLEANPEDTWTPAIRNIHAALGQRRLLTQPVKPTRLRLMLRDLQTSRDRAGATGSMERAARIDTVLRQVVGVNAEQVLADADNADPVVRDLATFALAFLDDAKASERLRALSDDPSAQVRGTALVSLAVRGDPVGNDLLLSRLGDEEARVRGAAALLARRTRRRGGEGVQALLPPLIATLSAEEPWARRNAASAIAHLAPKGSAPAVRALLEAHEKEAEERFNGLYRAALKELTGLEAENIEPYRTWLEENGGANG